MKKKILIIVIAVVVIGGGVVAALALTGGGVSEEDKKQGEDTAAEVDDAMEGNTDMPEAGMDDAAADSLEEALGIDEEFDPNDI